MAESVQMNSWVMPETKRRVEEIARRTFRSKGDVIDWLVDEAWAKINDYIVAPVVEPAQQGEQK